MVTIISKIELEGTDNLNYSDVGYTSDQTIINQINEDYDATLGKVFRRKPYKIRTWRG